jgi:EmrB/QacA subfamily drug resistance transporter
MTPRSIAQKNTGSKTQFAALTASMLSALVNSLMNSSLNVALPAIGREFSMGAVSLGWVITSMLLSATVFVVPFGRIADIYGRKKMMIIGSALYALTSLLAAVSVNSWMLITVRIAQGVGAAMLFGTGVAILTSVFPPEKKGWALGWNVSAVYLGLTAGPFIGGLMTRARGWRSIFWLNVALGMLSLFVLVFLLKGDWSEAKGEKIDYPGSAVFGLTIVCLIYGMSKMPSMQGIILIITGAAMLLLFVKIEESAKSPLINMKLFENNTVFAFSNLATLIHYSSASSVGFLLSLYLQYVKGFDPAKAGLVLMAQPLVMVAFSSSAGHLSDRIWPGGIASIGMAVTMAGLLAFVFLTQATPLWAIVCSLLLIGGGFALFSSPNSNAVMGSVERKYYGLAAGMISTMRQTGQTMGIAIGTMMLSIFVGKMQVTPEKLPHFMSAVRAAFLVSTGLSFMGIFASLAGGNAGKTADFKHDKYKKI